MQQFLQSSVLLVVFHFIVTGVHGIAHQIIPVPISALQYLFIVPIITLAPVVAVVMLQNNFSKTGAVLLLCSMLGALIFGIYNHFIVISPDHISQIPATSWGQIFKITTVLLAISETLGVVIGLWGVIQQRKLAKIQ
ncbi:MAG: hypothetical protein ACRC8K_11895 [Waterburya sp.]